jgi:hypothetical protein
VHVINKIGKVYSLEYQRCSSGHIMDDEMSKASKGITNAKVVSKVTVAVMWY